MFKLIILLALCVTSRGLSFKINFSNDQHVHLSHPDPITSKLYITDDLYMLDFVDNYKSYSSNEMTKAGYLEISQSQYASGVINVNCSSDYYDIRQLKLANPEASRLLNSSIELMNNTLSDSSKKSMAISIQGSSVTIDLNNGFPGPKHVKAKGYDITVLAEGHCIVNGSSKTDGFQALVINKHSIVTILVRDIINEGRGCIVDKETEKILDDVKDIVSVC